MQEAVRQNNCDHPNLIKIYGIISGDHLESIVLEYMNMGDLLTYLRKPTQRITFKKAVKIASDIAMGCEYLESVKMVHRYTFIYTKNSKSCDPKIDVKKRDLAARNCLLSTLSDDPEDFIVKIGDFGLAR